MKDTGLVYTNTSFYCRLQVCKQISKLANFKLRSAQIILL